MLITNHVLAGASVGLLTPGLRTTGRLSLRRLSLAAAVGVASHFVMDSIPHWGAETAEDALPVAIADGLVGLVTSAAVLAATPPSERPVVAAGIFGACLPDTDQPFQLFFGRTFHPRWVDRFHGGIQTEHSWLPQEFLVAGVLATGFGLLVRRSRAAHT